MPDQGKPQLEFSVVIPTYNRRELVLKAIDSALSQSLVPREVIVVDDGSTDGTQQAISARFAGENVRLVRSSHAGASAARNLGVLESTSEYIAFLDSDDLYQPRKLERYAETIRRRPEAVLFHSHWNEWDESTDHVRRMTPTVEGDARHDLLMFAQIATPTVVIRKEDFLKVGGFRENLFLVEDYDLWCRISSLGDVVLIREPLSTVRLHGSNSYRDPHRVMINQLKVIYHYFWRYRIEGLDPRGDYVANSLYPVSFLLLKERSYREAVGLFFRAWRHDWQNNRRRSLRVIGRSLKALAQSSVDVCRRWMPAREKRTSPTS